MLVLQGMDRMRGTNPAYESSRVYRLLCHLFTDALTVSGDSSAASKLPQNIVCGMDEKSLRRSPSETPQASCSEVGESYFRSKRSRFMTLSQAFTKSFRNFSFESPQA